MISRLTSQPNTHKGLTAVELIVSMALFGVASLLMVSLFTRTTKISAHETARLQLEHSCFFLVQEVEEALKQSGVSGISYLEAPEYQAVATNPLEDVTSEGRLAWQGSQLFFFRQSDTKKVFKRLIRSSADPLPSPRRFTPDELRKLAGVPSPPVAEGVTRFHITNRYPDGNSRLIDISVEMERHLPNQEPEQYRIDKVAVVMN